MSIYEAEMDEAPEDADECAGCGYKLVDIDQCRNDDRDHPLCDECFWGGRQSSMEAQLAKMTLERDEWKAKAEANKETVLAEAEKEKDLALFAKLKERFKHFEALKEKKEEPKKAELESPKAETKEAKPKAEEPKTTKKAQLKKAKRLIKEKEKAKDKEAEKKAALDPKAPAKKA